MKEVAMQYASRKWPIFPCQGKKPLTDHGFKDASTDVMQVEKWWNRWPDANIGFAVPGNVLVVDVDNHGVDGSKTMRDLELFHGQLPSTPTARTGGGGQHYFFKVDAPLKCSTNALPGIDTRTAGGYVILPPSKHESGNAYKWEVEPGPALFAPLPDWLKTALVSKSEPPVQKLQKVQNPVYEGQRNEVLFKLASSLRAKGLSEAAMLAALREENTQRCSPPLDDSEVQKLVHSAGKYEQGQVHTASGDFNVITAPPPVWPTTPPPADTWEQPIPFNQINTPDFPTDALPEEIAAFVDALSISTQTPNEMGAILSLGVLATAFQHRYKVEVTPDWNEQLSLYTVAVAPPGERKTAVIGALMNPVRKYEAARRELEAAEIAQNQAERSTLEKALANAQAIAAKAKDALEAQAGMDRVLDLSAQLAEFKDKVPFRLVVDDTTPEKLVDIMDMREGCITVSSAEGGIFESMKGRYDKGAGFDIYLKGHAGDPISVDRIGRSSNYIPNPRLTMILTIQPEVLQGLIGDATFKGRGLCGRFLYAMCKSKVGSRDVNPQPIPREIREAYAQFVLRILGGLDTGTICLSPEAERLRIEYATLIEQRLGREWEFMRDWGGKLEGAMLRIAGLIHCAEVKGDPAAALIQPGILQAAISITEFLGKHAEAAYQIMGADQNEADAKYTLRRLLEIGKDEVTRRNLFADCQSHFGKIEAMEPALQRLEEMGYIRMTEVSTGGRPSKIILLNPHTKGTKHTEPSTHGAAGLATSEAFVPSVPFVTENRNFNSPPPGSSTKEACVPFAPFVSGTAESTPPPREQAKTLYAQGKTVKEIAETLGANYKTVSKWKQRDKWDG